MGLYLFPFLAAFLVSVGIIFILRKLSFTGRFNLRRNSDRHIGSSDISRLGGLAIIVSFLAIIFIDSNLIFSHTLWGLILGAIAILTFGLWDDFQELNWKVQLVFQVGLAVFVYFWGIRTEYISNPFGGLIFLNNIAVGLIFVIGWLLLSINSMNWLDGIDGASGGVAFLGALTIFLLALKPEVNQPPVAIIALALAGATLGFLVFNFHPGRIMAGTSGSMFFGFMLGSLAIFAGAKVATALLVMLVPIVDFLWVIGERIIKGVSIFMPDERHLHHKLIRLGWSQTKIALFFYAITLGMVVLSINTRLMGKMIAIFVALLLVFGIMMVINKRLAKLQ